MNIARTRELVKAMVNRKTITIVSVALVLIALPLTVYLGQQRQDIRQRASSGSVCTQAEFIDLTADQQEAVYCLSTDPVCVVKGTPASAGGASFDGNRPIVRIEAIALIARYHVNVLRDWSWSTTGAQGFTDVPPSLDLYKEVQTAKENGFIRGYDNGNGTFSLDPYTNWKFRYHGVNKAEYGAFPDEGDISRSDFVKAMYADGKKYPQQASLCQTKQFGPTNPDGNPTCSTTSKCTQVTYQSNDNGTHPLPGTRVGTTNMSCNFDANDATCQQGFQAGTGTITATNCTYASGGTCTLNWSTSGITPGLTAYIEAGIANESVPAGQISLIVTGASGSKEVTNIGTQRTFRLRVGRNPNASYNQNIDRVVASVIATAPAAPQPTATPVPPTATPRPTTYSISGVVTNGGGVTVNARPTGSAGASVVANPIGTYAITNLSAGYYVVSVTTTASQVSTPVTYGVTVGSSCSIIQSGTTATCGTDGNASKVNFTLSASPTVTTAPTATIAPTAANTPIPTVAVNKSLIAVTFKQHGIGLAADNANPNPTPLSVNGTIQPIPTPVAAFQSRSATLYLSTGNTITDGVPTYEYQKTGTVTYAAGNNLYGYQGTFDLGTAVPAGQYNVAIRTNNAISQQATGFVTITPGQTTTITFPSLISGNVYDTSIDNASPTNDNQLDILDYNAIMDNWLNPNNCDTKTGTALQVCQTIKLRADLNADGTVDVLDYNLFIREMSVYRGR